MSLNRRYSHNSVNFSRITLVQQSQNRTVLREAVLNPPVSNKTKHDHSYVGVIFA